ncbi:hypothetical protein [Burkholderia sp. NLJ2]|uniref:hypothetical protein n=1 Tax=Burkholderia sp. NLJ2 TaxID=3090699 RepID=UPI003C6C6EE5
MDADSKTLQECESAGHDGGTRSVADLWPQRKRKSRPRTLIFALAVSSLLCSRIEAAAAELTATSSEPTPNADQTTVADGFNKAVALARKLNFIADNWAFFTTPSPNGLGWPSAQSDPRCPSSTQDLSPGYLAAIQNRCAYYSRDYVHQATGAYYLGYYEQNYQMADHFVTPLHDNGGVKAPYWAIGANGKIYEQNDESPAPFEIGENIAKMYRLTADNRYLGVDFTNYTNNINNGFTNVSNNKYINSDGFRMARVQNGEAATYNEFVHDRGNNLPTNLAILLGGDMASSEIAYYRAISAYTALKSASDTTNVTNKYDTLSNNFNANWYLSNSSHFSVGLVGTTDNTYDSSNYNSLNYYDYYAQEPNIFPLYKGVITDSARLASQANYVDTQSENLYRTKGDLAYPGIESHTYLPTAFYNANQRDTAWKWLTRLAKWQVDHGNNTYPEVAFAMVSDVITKVLGVDYDAPNSVLSTLSGLPPTFTKGNFVKVDNIPIYNKQKNVTINVAVTQKVLDANGMTETDLGFDTDLATVASNQGFHWAPGFRNAGTNTHCTVTRTFANGSSDSLTYSLRPNSATGISTCVDSSNIGIWVYTGDSNSNVRSLAAVLAP